MGNEGADTVKVLEISDSGPFPTQGPLLSLKNVHGPPPTSKMQRSCDALSQQCPNFFEEGLI